MIQSMTGFGKGEAAVGGYTATAEIRSVNSRYLELNVKLPQALSTREMEVREMIRQRVGRGKLSILISTTGVREEDEIAVDVESVKRIIALLKLLKRSAEISSPIRLEHLLSFKDLFKGGGGEESNSEEWEAAKAAVDSALNQLQESRTAEGLSLKKEIQPPSVRIVTVKEAQEKIIVRSEPDYFFRNV